ncbi:MAG: UDP-N-acetylmuramoyl-L-alanine--D-glutamate ligase [bacterium]|nr:UDP-N-acetylmuramoyl-L-alanine--D-glutamate ligase [bacterium]
MSKALVIGLAKSGVASIQILLKKGYRVRAADIKEERSFPGLRKEFADVEFFFGPHEEDCLSGADLLVISPGVPSDLPLIVKARQQKIKVISEVELAYEHYSRHWVCVTGTDGKSTTTSLIGAILKQAGVPVIVAGNIGEPLTEEILKAGEGTYVVAELSSFQLENIVQLRPEIGILVNIARDHLDRYKDMEEYIRAKFNLFRNQQESDHSVFNSGNALSMEWLKRIPVSSDTYFFSLARENSRGAFFKEGAFWWKEDGKEERVLPDGIQKIQGIHNKENILAAITAAKILKIKNKKIERAVRDFKGLPHRMEFVRELKGRSFYNDSKATTTSAVKMSIAGFSNVILLMGGRDKGLDYSELNETLNRNVKYLILIGEAKEKIRSMIRYDQERIYLIDDFKKAVEKSYEISRPGDHIILSPACTSYDMFRNFEERGERFRKEVLALS